MSARVQVQRFIGFVHKCSDEPFGDARVLSLSMDITRRHGRLPASVTLAALAACAGNGDGLDENGRPEGADDGELRAEFASIQSHVFTPVCTTCHAGAAAPLGLRLDADVSYAMLVNAASVEVPDVLRVDPGNPDSSYLIQKLEGTAAVGGRMPLDGTPLPQSTIDVIRQWIVDGAQPPSAQSVAARPVVLSAAVTPDAVIRSKGRLEILIAASGELDTSSLHAASVRLLHAGTDGSFGDADDRDVTGIALTVRTLAPTSIEISISDAELAPGWYRLLLSGSAPAPVSDRNGAAIDGDRNGSPGGDFLHDFETGNLR